MYRPTGEDIATCRGSLDQARAVSRGEVGRGRSITLCGVGGRYRNGVLGVVDLYAYFPGYEIPRRRHLHVFRTRGYDLRRARGLIEDKDVILPVHHYLEGVAGEGVLHPRAIQVGKVEG